MDLAKLNQVLAKEPKYRYQQINKAIYVDFLSSWSQVTSLPKALRAELELACPLEIEAELSTSKESRSIKALLKLADGNTVETVLIKHGPDKQVTHTVCLSSQIGCPLACTFCASGKEGLIRNLSSAEIVSQVIFWGRYLKTESLGKIDNLVFMGMGEPFLNYENFISALRTINNPEKINLGARKISVSTAGIVPGIQRLAGEKLQVNLAISLHASNDSLRQKIMPSATKYSIAEIIKVARDYVKKTGRKVMFEYILLDQVNDRESDAFALAKILKQPLFFLNLIPYNPTGSYQASTKEAVDKFQAVLDSCNMPYTVRHSAGTDIVAACGQLRAKKDK